MSDGQSESIEAANRPDPLGEYRDPPFGTSRCCKSAVYYSQEHDNFYCSRCRKGQGNNFYSAIATPGGLGSSPELRAAWGDLGEGPLVGQTSKPEKGRNG